jgi:hypothetical protein
MTPRAELAELLKQAWLERVRWISARQADEPDPVWWASTVPCCAPVPLVAAYRVTRGASREEASQR